MRFCSGSKRLSEAIPHTQDFWPFNARSWVKRNLDALCTFHHPSTPRLPWPYSNRRWCVCACTRSSSALACSNHLSLFVKNLKYASTHCHGGVHRFTTSMDFEHGLSTQCDTYCVCVRQSLQRLGSQCRVCKRRIDGLSPKGGVSLSTFKPVDRSRIDCLRRRGHRFLCIQLERLSPQVVSSPTSRISTHHIHKYARLLAVQCALVGKTERLFVSHRLH